MGNSWVLWVVMKLQAVFGKYRKISMDSDHKLHAESENYRKLSRKLSVMSGDSKQ